MPDSQSFFDRFPWIGFLLFMGLLGIVGGILAIKIGERPHYRGEWKLVSDAPAQGSIPSDAEFRDDKVHVQVLLRVENPDRSAGIGYAATLREKTTEKTLASGTTSAPGGHLLLPVPARFDSALFQNQLEVTVETLEHGLVRGAIEPPRRGQCRATIELASAPTGYVSGTVQDAGGKPVAGALLMVESADENPPSPIAFVDGGRSDKNGRYHFKGKRPFERARIVAFGDGVSARTREPVRLPHHDLALVLQPSGALRIRFALPDLSPNTELRVELAPPGAGDMKPIQSRTQNFQPERAMEWDGVPPGPYLLRVLGPKDRELARESLNVGSGETSEITLPSKK